jgi:hypothetical protein
VKRANLFGKLSARHLRISEDRYAQSLPEEYQEFLLKYKEGDPSPRNIIDFVEAGQSTSSDVQFIYGIHEGPYGRACLESDPPSFACMTYVAASFAEFLDKLHEYPDPVDARGPNAEV